MSKLNKAILSSSNYKISENDIEFFLGVFPNCYTLEWQKIEEDGDRGDFDLIIGISGGENMGNLKVFLIELSFF